ncbi:MAG: hypothetical protein IPI73_14545 [Betaproteobacteria bacterium]|nr:hypothetical protein [Betaproteobacteria bacterium]
MRSIDGADGEARMTGRKKAIEMQGRTELETLVRARTAELSELANYLDQAREDERRSLARELHDELGSIFTAARLDVAFIKARCPASHPELIAKCDRIAAMLDQGAAFKRRIVDRLYPATLDLLGLAPALRELVEDVASAFPIAIAAEIDGDIVERDETALAIYRIVQSALGNVTRMAMRRKSMWSSSVPATSCGSVFATTARHSRRRGQPGPATATPPRCASGWRRWRARSPWRQSPEQGRGSKCDSPCVTGSATSATAGHTRADSRNSHCRAGCRATRILFARPLLARHVGTAPMSLGSGKHKAAAQSHARFPIGNFWSGNSRFGRPPGLPIFVERGAARVKHRVRPSGTGLQLAIQGMKSPKSQTRLTGAKP